MPSQQVPDGGVADQTPRVKRASIMRNRSIAVGCDIEVFLRIMEHV